MTKYREVPREIRAALSSTQRSDIALARDISIEAIEIEIKYRRAA